VLCSSTIRHSLILPAKWYESTETPFKMHTGSRPPQTPAAPLKRLIESDAAVNGRSVARLTVPRHFR
jgi:hypothetical protein